MEGKEVATYSTACVGGLSDMARKSLDDSGRPSDCPKATGLLIWYHGTLPE